MVVLYTILVLLGIALIVIELVVLPGVGVAGIGGTLLVLAGLWAFFHIYGTAAGFGALAVTLVLLCAAVAAALRYRTWRRLSLHAEIDGRVNEHGQMLHPGDTGVALTRLAPMGMALFAGETFEVSTEESLIDAGTPLEVLRVQDGRIFVRAAAPEAGTEENHDSTPIK